MKEWKESEVDDIKLEGYIYIVRGVKVMVEYDLADLYGVDTKRLNEQVKRNLKRFPDDFMFQLSNEEFVNLEFQKIYGKFILYPFAGVQLYLSCCNAVKFRRE